MADITQLELEPPDQVEWDSIQGPGTGSAKVLPPEGETLTFRLSNITAGATRERKRQYTFDVTVVGGQYDGFTTRFQRASVKRFSFRNSSQVIDYLRGAGITAEPRTNDEYDSLFLSLEGRDVQGTGVWRGYDKDTGYELKGMDKFPQLEDGTYQSWAPNPYDESKRVWANFEVRKVLPAV